MPFVLKIKTKHKEHEVFHKVHKVGLVKVASASKKEKFALGRSQVVRHRSLDPAFVGSSPPAPANFDFKNGLSLVLR